jgi:hypothetical protein
VAETSRQVLPPSIECHIPDGVGESVMTNIPAPQGPGFIDNPLAPDVHADAATGFFVFSGNIRITFESLRVNHISSPGPVNRVVIGRLIMPFEQAEHFAKGLLHFIDQQRNQPSLSPQTTTTLQ